MTDVRNTLNARGKTYGSYAINADISQALKEYFRKDAEVWEAMPAHCRETLDMMAQKLCRILSSTEGWQHADNFRDIAGYATLSMDRVLQDFPEPDQVDI